MLLAQTRKDKRDFRTGEAVEGPEIRRPPDPRSSLERRGASRTFPYGYLVTTSPQSPTIPSAPASLAGWLSDFEYNRLSWCDGRCVQGPGTYSPRRADARLLAIPPSCRRVAACNLNLDRLFGVSSTSRSRIPLYRPLSHVCRP